MRAPAPLALGCVSFALCLLELPRGRALPPRRDSPARRPPELIPSLLGDRTGPEPPAPPPLPAGTPRHRPPDPRHRPPDPRHGSWVSPRRGARPAPRHRLLARRRPPWHVQRLLLRHDRRRDPRRDPRPRRHAGGHAVRVGCVLGTCQVQNLSHRLWQLRGLSGRRDSSPMNPNSPHSYG
ncbi:protein ADM2 [Myiozetetes cayanensis]|uniref:protein ADM2 n=1 Tax=Myiozetetes cayanensis TaxID=478635 RepID=UPI00215E704D|nr:protein ADM2 [Myiozetetes cayanensis]